MRLEKSRHCVTAGIFHRYIFKNIRKKDYFLFLGHLSHSGRASSVVRKHLFDELLSQSLQNLVCSICMVRRQEIVKFMTPHPHSKGR